MDPLSIIASSIAVIGASSKLAKGLRKLLALPDAPQEIQTLFNDVSSLHVILKVVHEVLEQLGTTERQGALTSIQREIEEVVKPVEECVQDLQNFVEQQLLRSEKLDRNGLPKPARLAWLRNSKDIERLRQRIRDSRSNLDTALSSLHVLLGHNVYQTTIKIEDIIIQTFEGMKSAQTEMGSSAQAQALEDQEWSFIPEDDLRPQETDDVLGREHPRRVSGSGIDSSPFQMAKSRSRICITTSITRASCPRFCQCQCHNETTIATPQWLKGLVGSVLVTYTGLSLIKSTSCDYLPCKNTSKQSSLMYYLPTWAPARALLFYAEHSSLSGIGVRWSLRIPIVLRDSHPIWKAAQIGNIDFIRQQFSKHTASPYVVDKNGWTLLHWTASWDQPDCYKFLKASGCDETQEDATKSNPLDLALTFGSLPRVTRFMENIEDMMDVLSYSPLHLAAMGRVGSVSTLIQPYFKDMNAQDRCGMTPLHWACSCNNWEAVKVLLEWKARVDIQDRQGALALHHACRSGDPSTIEGILRAGSDVRVLDNHGETALFYVRSPSAITILVEHGLDLNHKSNAGQTALHYAAGDSERSGLLESLIENGGDVNITNDDNYTPLMTAIAKNCHECMEVLIRKGAVMDRITTTGSNVLHIAALMAGPKALDLLCNNISGQYIDPDTLDKDENSPSDCFLRRREEDNFNLRASRDDESRCWDALLEKARRQKAHFQQTQIATTPLEGSQNQEREVTFKDISHIIMPGSFP